MAGRTLPKTLTREELDALYARPNLAAPTGLRNRCILELMAEVGLRRGDVIGAHLRDWRPRDHQLHIRPEVGKGGVEAYLPLPERVEDLLDRWKHVRRGYAAGAPHLFVTLRGTPLGKKYVSDMVSRYARRAEIERRISPHALRHTFATELLRSGDFNIREVQELMRHADVSTTMIYTHISDEQLAAKVRGRRR